VRDRLRSELDRPTGASPAAPRLTRRAFAGAALAALCACDDPAPPAPPIPPRASARSPAPPPGAAAVAIAPPHVPPLLRAFPALAARLPRVPLGLLPTPVERAARLGRRAGIEALLVKRDDLSGAAYGGGKTRKLELLLGEAREAGARAVVTFGGAGSNQAVATALYAAELGLRAILLLAPQPGGEHLRQNLLAALRAGAEIRLVSSVAEAEAEARRMARRAPAAAPHVIPAGGSSPLGNLAFVNAAFELADQIAAGEAPAPDRIYVAMGTMGSAAGLAIGLRALGLAARVVAVRCSGAGTSSEPALLAAAAATVAYARRLDPSFPDVRLRRGDVLLDDRHLGAGYARATAAGLRAIAMAREEEGWTLEPTYTGKALAALLGDARALAGKVALFWHTHSARPLDVEGADPRSLPAGLQVYFAGAAP
jgi:D-cysteine desulfhydrase